MKPSIVWNIFIRNNKDEAQCSICKKKLKYYGSTTNLKKHLSKIHPIQYRQEVENEVETEPIAGPSNESSINNTESTASKIVTLNKCVSDCSTSLPQPKRKKQLKLFGGSSTTELSDSNKKDLDDSLLKMVVLDYQPFSFVENAGFREFVNKLNSLYKIPDRKHLTNTMLANKYADAVSTVKKIINEVNYVSVTTDIWTSDSNKAYISLTCHFVYNDKLRSQVLSTNEILGAHTGKNIGDAINVILNDWEIADKVVTFVSDNGSNIKCAINQYIQKHHHPCVAHTLNVCVTDSIKENETFNLILKKCRTLVTHFKHSVLASEKLTNTQKQMGFSVLKVKQDVSTRWNSSLIMLERLLEIKDALSITLSDLPKAPASLDATEWAIIWDCVPVLKPIEVLTSILSAEKYATISLIIPLIRGLQHSLNYLNTTTEVGSQLKNSLIDVIGRRLAPLEKDKIVAKATLLDPRFKAVGFGLEENSKNAELWLVEEVKKIINRNNNINQQDQDIVKNQENNPSKEKLLVTSSDPSKDLWSFFDNKIVQTKSVITASTTAMLNVKQYLQMENLNRKKCPFELWEQQKNIFPELYESSEIFMCSWNICPFRTSFL